MRGGLLAWMSTGFLCSQPTFEHVVPAPGEQYPVAVRQTVDGGYLLAGYTAPSGGYDQDGYLALLSPNGEETSAHPLNSPTRTTLVDLDLAPTGFVAIAGRLDAISGQFETTLIGLDDAGAERWSHVFPRAPDRDSQSFYDLAPTPTGGWIVAGLTSISASSTYYPLVIEFDEDGDVLWSHELSSSSGGAVAIDATTDGGWILATGADSSVVLRKIDQDGNETWSTTIHPQGTYAYPLYASVGGLALTTDRGLVVAWSATYVNSRFGIMTGETQLVKLDTTTGETVWIRSQPNALATPRDFVNVVRASADGGVLIAGTESYTMGCGYGFSWCTVSTGLLERLDGSGASLWRRELGTTSQQISLTDAWVTFDHGAIAVGRGTFSPDAGRLGDLYAVRTDSAGGVAPPSNLHRPPLEIIIPPLSYTAFRHKIWGLLARSRDYGFPAKERLRANSAQNPPR
ncbi:MAG: PQQ-binding-like beta-propeller repeat protein [Deltaproteobacteria bacterium]|nr:PQQ-binding-like beta-propeller repeat protein [Deltaproteobacteria bacterium]